MEKSSSDKLPKLQFDANFKTIECKVVVLVVFFSRFSQNALRL